MKEPISGRKMALCTKLSPNLVSHKENVRGMREMSEKESAII